MISSNSSSNLNNPLDSDDTEKAGERGGERETE